MNFAVFACTDRSREVLEYIDIEPEIVFTHENNHSIELGIKEYDIDICLVLGWHDLIPEELLKLDVKWIGRHLSLLPKRRGRAPVSWALIEGLDRTGVSLFYLSNGIDNGDIIDQGEVEITSDDTARGLHNKLNNATIDLINKHIPLWDEGTFERYDNPDELATYTHPRRPDMGLIDWTKDQETIYNFIRAQSHPYPGAFTYHKMDKLICWSALDKEGFVKGKPGEVLKMLEDDVMEVCTGDGKPLLVHFEKVQDRWNIEIGDILGRSV